MKPNKDIENNSTNVCIKCINVDVNPGESPCTPQECEISAILSGTFQYLEQLKREEGK